MPHEGMLHWVSTHMRLCNISNTRRGCSVCMWKSVYHPSHLTPSWCYHSDTGSNALGPTHEGPLNRAQGVLQLNFTALRRAAEVAAGTRHALGPTHEGLLNRAQGVLQLYFAAL